MARVALKVVVRLAILLLVIAMMAVALTYVVLETRPGHDLVLRAALSQVPNHIDGDVRIGTLRSDGLLRGFVLHDISIRDERGRPFLEADSVRVRYAFRELLRGRIALVPAEAWAPRVVIETLHGDERSNLARIFRMGDPAGEPVGPEVAEDAGAEGEDQASGVSLVLRRVRIRDGDLLVRTPLDDDEDAGRIAVETLDEVGGRYRRIRVSGVDARIREADILRPDAEGERVDLEGLSFTARILDEPFEVRDFAGVVERAGSEVRLEAERLELPTTSLSGRIAVDWGAEEGGVLLDVDTDVASAGFADLRWLEPRIPEGSGRLHLDVEGPLATSRWRITGADVEVAGSRVRGDLGFDLGDEIVFSGTDLRLEPFELALLEPWLEEPLPVTGRLRGDLQASGSMRGLDLAGEVTYDDPARDIPASTATLNGRAEFGDELVLRGFELDVDPLRYPTLTAFAPDLELVGEGSARVEVSGALGSRFTISGELVHAVDGAGRSRVTAAGLVRLRGDDVHVDLAGNLSPLSLEGLGRGIGRDLPVGGEVTGPVQALGVLDDMEVVVNVATAAGGITGEGRLDLLDPAAGYIGRGRVRELALHQLVEGLPEPTVVSGDFEIDGRGAEPETLAGNARLSLAPVRIGDAELERVSAALRAEGGRLVVDELELRSPFGYADGAGDLALRGDEPDGTVSLSWEASSLAAFRPLLLGDRVIAADTLTDLERDVLRSEGIDPDTLPDARSVTLEGEANGAIHLTGTVEDIRAEGFAEMRDAVYGDLSLSTGRAEFEGDWRGSDDWRVGGEVALDELRLGRFAFDWMGADLAYRPGEGEVALDVRRSDEQAYRMDGGFSVDDGGIDVRLESLALDIEREAWTLDEPVLVTVRDRTLQMGDVRVTRPALAESGAVRIEARGTLSLDGESDFETRMRGVDLARLASVFQMEDPPDGTLDLALDIQGPAAAPRMVGDFVVRDFAAGGAELSRVEGMLEYGDRLARAELEAEQDGRRLLHASGSVPVDLGFHEVEDRFLDRELDVRVAVDSLPAASVLAFAGALDDVEGTLAGEVDLRGTTRQLRPSGEVRLRDGAASLTEQGLRITQVAGGFRVAEDRTVEVDAEGRARGTARMQGTISLDDLTDPGFDLRIDAAGFQAIDRRDLNARVGGEMTLTGSYRSPQVGGSVRVEEGSLFLEEIARTAEVVDLTDPAFFDVVDTTLVAARPAAVAENPFIRNLQVGVDLIIQRGFWLRSRDMNVEMEGELAVTFERPRREPRRELILSGTLQAVRGSYTAFGRQFQVLEGTVEFMGTPGIDPSLELQAINRVRREGGEPLDVTATLGGTLENMQVELSSDAQPPIAQSDLISYLVFGRPSYALGSGERSVLEGAAGAGVGVGLGAIATQLGSVVAQQFGVDYFTITQVREGEAGLPTAAGLAGTLAETQIEVGQYVGQNLFLALTLRPLTGLGTRTETRFPGARLEWRFTDQWTAEGFLEDRFAREAASGFGELGLRLDKILGFSLYREWGY